MWFMIGYHEEADGFFTGFGFSTAGACMTKESATWGTHATKCPHVPALRSGDTVSIGWEMGKSGTVSGGVRDYQYHGYMVSVQLNNKPFVTQYPAKIFIPEGEPMGIRILITGGGDSIQNIIDEKHVLSTAGYT
jgi:hypothetical protein